jgi:polar amino acid transport system substrate-binding protein
MTSVLRNCCWCIIAVLMNCVWNLSAKAESWDVYTETTYPPYNFEKDGVWTGIDTEIIERVMSELGIAIKYHKLPWKRVVKAVEENKADFGYQFVGKPERFEKFHMIGPIRTGEWVFAVRANSTIIYDKMNDLQSYTIGTNSGYGYPKAFLDSGLKKQPVASMSQNIKLLLRKRIDLIIGDRLLIAYYARIQGVHDQIKFLPNTIENTPRYIAFPKQKEIKARLFEAKLNALKRSGEIDEILQRWR